MYVRIADTIAESSAVELESVRAAHDGVCAPAPNVAHNETSGMTSCDECECMEVWKGTSRTRRRSSLFPRPPLVPQALPMIPRSM